MFAHAMSKVDNVPDTAMWQSLRRLYFKCRCEVLDVQGFIVEEGFVLRESMGGPVGVPEWSAEDGDGGSARVVRALARSAPR